MEIGYSLRRILVLRIAMATIVVIAACAPEAANHVTTTNEDTVQPESPSSSPTMSSGNEGSGVGTSTTAAVVAPNPRTTSAQLLPRGDCSLYNGAAVAELDVVSTSDVSAVISAITDGSTSGLASAIAENGLESTGSQPTPIIVASASGCVELMKLLLDAGADPNQVPPEEFSF